MNEVTRVFKGELPPILPYGLLIGVEGCDEIGFEIKTTEQADEQDKWLLTQEEWSEVEGDDEDIMIAQYNKIVKYFLDHMKEQSNEH